jgi:hypothetical protein
VRGITILLNKGKNMLQKAFFKVDVLNPTKITDALIFEKKGTLIDKQDYYFVVPEGYNSITIEYAGASGGYSESGVPGGGGSIKKITMNIAQGEKVVISGTVGGCGDRANESNSEVYSYGGEGYSDGEQGYSGTGQLQYVGYVSGGGGGGSTSVNINGVIYEASGGGGAAIHEVNTGYGGKGGGAFGGARKNSKKTNDKKSMKGNDATDPEQIGLNKTENYDANGYVKIYGSYDPFLKD